MVVEIAKYEVKPDRIAAFVEATQIGKQIFGAAEGCVSMEIRQCVEHTGSFRMIVFWRTLEDHVVTFRASAGVQSWRAAIAPFLQEPAEILNFDEPIVRAGAMLSLGDQF